MTTTSSTAAALAASSVAAPAEEALPPSAVPCPEFATVMVEALANGSASPVAGTGTAPANGAPDKQAAALAFEPEALTRSAASQPQMPPRQVMAGESQSLMLGQQPEAGPSPQSGEVLPGRLPLASLAPPSAIVCAKAPPRAERSSQPTMLRPASDSSRAAPAGLEIEADPAPPDTRSALLADTPGAPHGPERTREPLTPALMEVIASLVLPFPNGTAPAAAPGTSPTAEAPKSATPPAAPATLADRSAERPFTSGQPTANDRWQPSSLPQPVSDSQSPAAMQPTVVTVAEFDGSAAENRAEDGPPPSPGNVAAIQPPVNDAVGPKAPAGRAEAPLLPPAKPQSEEQPATARLTQPPVAETTAALDSSRGFNRPLGIESPPAVEATLEPGSREINSTGRQPMTGRMEPDLSPPIVRAAATRFSPALAETDPAALDSGQLIASQPQGIAIPPPAALTTPLGQPAVEITGPLAKQSTAPPARTESPSDPAVAEQRNDISSSPSAGETALCPMPSGDMIARLEADETAAVRTARTPLSPPDGLSAEAGHFNAPSPVAAAAERSLPEWRVHSAAEVRYAPPEPPDAPTPAAGAAPLRAGTGTAEQDDGMKKAAEPKQFAGPAQQNLPEAAVAALDSGSDPLSRGRARSIPARELAEARTDSASPLASLLSSNQSGMFSREELGALPAPVASNSATPAESLQSSVLKHVTELRHAGAAEMSVVLKPDAETQLSLRLSLGSNGEITVQARCEQGDAQLLAANWGDLRSSLAQQGVRVSALEFSHDRSPGACQPPAGNGGPSPDGRPASQRPGLPWPETLDDLPLAGSLTEPPARRGVQRPLAGRARRWESWA